MSLASAADSARTLTFDIACALSGAGMFSLLTVVALRLMAS